MQGNSLEAISDEEFLLLHARRDLCDTVGMSLRLVVVVVLFFISGIASATERLNHPPRPSAAKF